MNKNMKEEFDSNVQLGAKEPQKLGSCGKEALAELIEQAGKKKPVSGVQSGFTKLDEITDGFQGGELIVIAGMTMMGKTSLALSMARQMAVDQHIPVMFATYEMKETVLSKRLIAAQCDIPLQGLVCAIVNPEQWKDIEKKVEPLVASPFTVADVYEYDLNKLINLCRDKVQNDHVKAIFIDSIQYIFSDSFYGKNRLDIYESMPALKLLARELDIPIFITSALSGSVFKFNDYRQRPTLSDLPDTSVIENFSDKIIIVHRPEFYHIYQDDCGRDMRGVAILQVEKNKGGYRGDIYLDFKEECGKFTNQTLFKPLS